MRTLPALALATLALAAPASRAAPPAGAPVRGDRMEERHGPKSREQREKMLRRVHTQFVLELGELLGLDTAGTIKLSERLKKFDDQRVQLRLDTYDAVGQLRAIARGEGTGDATAIARRMAANRTKLAELDQKELDEVLQGIPPDKAARVALFVPEFGRRVERMAHMMRDDKQGHGGGRGGPGGGRGGWGPPGGFEPGDDER